MRIADYISEHYVSKDKAATVDEQLDNTSTEAEQQSALNVEVKVYYTHAFPTDSLGQYIPDGVTFKDFNDALVSGNLETVKVEAVYVNDSVVRERIFAHLAKITNQKVRRRLQSMVERIRKSQPPTVAVQDDTKEKAELATRYAILDAAMKVARDDMSAVDARYTDGYSDMFFRNTIGLLNKLRPTVLRRRWILFLCNPYLTNTQIP